MTDRKRLRFRNKRRRLLYSKFVRIMDKVDRGHLPMVIKEVYLFGGFLRNKASPTDIDILLIYDSDATLQMYEAVGSKGDRHWRFWEVRKSPSRLRGRLKRNAERTVDINICPSLEEFQRDLAYSMDLWLRVWTPESRDWRATLFDHFERIQMAGPRLLQQGSPGARSGSRYKSPRRDRGSGPASAGRRPRGAARRA
jgi:predicted nucleotidyltransferase